MDDDSKSLTAFAEDARTKCSDLGLPIDFDLCNEDDDAIGKAILLATRASRCYVGATQDPSRRWLGDGDMQGHCESYERMILLAVKPPGGTGAHLESSLISNVLDSASSVCDNKARDARGQSRWKANFVYIVLCFDPVRQPAVS